MRPYVRDVGLIIAGPNVKLVWVDGVRRQRAEWAYLSDRSAHA